MDIRQITDQFATEGVIGEISPHGGGHINDSYHLVNNEKGQPDFLLQRINHYVFKDVELLMKNMAIVTDHIAALIGEKDPENVHRKSLRIIPTKKGGSFYKDPEGNYWRVLNFIQDHVVYERATDPEIAYEGARMFGKFTFLLSGVDAGLLGETIPRFHNIKWRLSNLRDSIREDKAGRVHLVKEEISYVEKSADLMSTIQELGEQGSIPLRVTHNDTKINNVLFDRNKKGLCVIDLDTVMPGYVHYDMGDGIRTFTNTGEEDDENLENISMDLELYRAFANGFLDSTREILTPTEIDTLVYAGLLFPYIMGVRFLTDYIAGDVYYKIKHKEHNLVRARAQLKLAQDGESKLDQCREIIRSLA